MAYVPPTAADLKARFPEFTDVSDTLVNLILAEASAQVGETWIERDRKPATLYLAAHMLAMEGEPGRSAGGTGGGTSGPVRRRKVGDVETEFAGFGSPAGGGGSRAVSSDRVSPVPDAVAFGLALVVFGWCEALVARSGDGPLAPDDGTVPFVGLEVLPRVLAAVLLLLVVAAIGVRARVPAVAWVPCVVVAPLAAGLGSEISDLDNFDSFECRGRNRVAGAQLSEHGRANALDVRGVKLADGRSISLTDREVPRDTREAILHSMCTRFMTVLGPGSDGYHEEHIHFDIAARHNGYRICQWDVRDKPVEVAAVIPLPRPRPGETSGKSE